MNLGPQLWVGEVTHRENNKTVSRKSLMTRPLSFLASLLLRACPFRQPASLRLAPGNQALRVQEASLLSPSHPACPQLPSPGPSPCPPRLPSVVIAATAVARCPFLGGCACPGPGGRSVGVS